ncbi:hypothetical protein [Sulfitobacter pontiacus]|nr:hypothetical protein [Sulfitobacter pontiacus]
MPQQFDLLKASAITEIQEDLEGVVSFYRDQAELAAKAAGAPLVSALIDPVPANNTIVILQTSAGGQVWEVVGGVWVIVGWITKPEFPNLAAMAASSGLTNGQEVTANGERFEYKVNGERDAEGELVTADNALVVDAVGMTVGQLVSKRTDYNSFNEMKNDVRSLPDGTSLTVNGLSNYTVNSEGMLPLAGGLTVDVEYGNAGFSTKAFGIFGGNTDITELLQIAVTASRNQGGVERVLRVNSGIYKTADSIILGIGQYIIFDPGVKINHVPPTQVDIETKPLFVASGQSEVYLFGNGAKLVGTKTGAVAEGLGSGIYLYGVKNFGVYDFNISNFATDGVQITGDNTGAGPCENGVISNVSADSCRRNGFSLICYRSVTLINPRGTNSGGAPVGPWAGIDVEPNFDCFAQGLTIINPYTSGNAGYGLLIVPGALAGASVASNEFYVTVLGGRSVSDGATAGTNYAALQFANGGAMTNRVFGQVSVRDYTVVLPKSRGVSWHNWDADKSPRVVLDNVQVLDPDGTRVAATNNERTGFVIDCNAAMATSNMGNIHMKNCGATDRRGGSSRMIWGCILDAGSGKSLKNILIENFVSDGQLAAAKYDVNTAFTTTAGSGENVVVRCDDERSVDLSGSQVIGGFGGMIINVPSGSPAFTLPAAAKCKGLSFIIQNADGVSAVTVTTQTADKIRGYDVAGVDSIVLDDGGYLHATSAGGNMWRIKQVAGGR